MSTGGADLQGLSSFGSLDCFCQLLLQGPDLILHREQALSALAEPQVHLTHVSARNEKADQVMSRQDSCSFAIVD